MHCVGRAQERVEVKPQPSDSGGLLRIQGVVEVYLAKEEAARLSEALDGVSGIDSLQGTPRASALVRYVVSDSAEILDGLHLAGNPLERVVLRNQYLPCDGSDVVYAPGRRILHASQHEFGNLPSGLLRDLVNVPVDLVLRGVAAQAVDEHLLDEDAPASVDLDCEGRRNLRLLSRVIGDGALGHRYPFNKDTIEFRLLEKPLKGFPKGPLDCWG